MRILYVQDALCDANLTRRQLRKAAPHFELEVVSSQSEAIARLQQFETRLSAGGPEAVPSVTRKDQSCDLVLTDMRLTDGDGLSLLNYVREHSLPLAVVVITGAGDEETAAAMLKAGADDYVIKRENYLESLPRILGDALVRYRAESARQARPLRVLYAERNGFDVDSTRRHLARHAPHIHLEVVVTGDELFHRLPQTGETSQYDVILLDYRLPGKNALEVLKDLRQDRGQDIPVLLVTGQGDEEVALQAIKLGAAGYLVKSPGYLQQLPGELENAYYRSELIREQMALRESEERYRSVVETQTELICRYRPDTTLTFVNEAYCRYFGKAREELVGTKFLQLIPEPARDAAYRHVESLIENPRLVADEHEVVMHDGGIGWQQWVDHAIFDSAGGIVEFQAVGRDITERKRAEEALRRSEAAVRKSHEQIQDLCGKLITAQEEERKRVSRELHDDVNQKLAVLGIAISKLRQRVPESLASVSDELSQLENRTHELAKAVHQLSHQLHPSILDHFGLVAALESCCSEFRSHTGIDVKLTVDEIESIPPDVALCLYRITQESLRNVAKHSGAKSTLVQLTYTHDGIQLFISDAGAGFDLHQAKGKGGLGLVSIDERVRILQGNLRIEAKPGFGTKLLVSIPHREVVRQAAQNA